MTRFGFDRTRLVVYLAAALVAAVGTFWPTPYSLLLPGSALDLDTIVSIPGHASPGVHLYMTDVSLVTNAAPFTLIDAFFPGVRVLKTDDVIPASVPAGRFESLMRDAMQDSQKVSVYVAERAAGYAMPPVRTQVVVSAVAPTSRAALRAGDVLTSIDGAPLRTVLALRAALANVRPGAIARIGYLRDGKPGLTAVTTIALDGKTKLGVYIGESQNVPTPPVPVRFTIHNVSGSSGGLMFALEIYRTLRPSGAHANERIAGTGTLDSDGNVGEIAGTMQKLVAARRAGATVFLVPIKNYAEVKDQHDLRVIPIGTFDEAVRALAS
jgi:PDZ domain-containing protein